MEQDNNRPSLLSRIVYQYIGIVILGGLYALSLKLEPYWQPEGSDKTTFEIECKKLISKAHDKGVECILPALKLIFKGVIDTLNSVYSGLGETTWKYGAVFWAGLLSVVYVVAMVFIGLTIQHIVFRHQNTVSSRIRCFVGSFFFENVWFTGVAYLWILIGKIIGSHAKITTIVMVVLIIAGHQYIIGSILILLFYVFLLYGGCCLIMNLCTHIPESPTQLRIAGAIILALLMRFIIDSIIDFVLDLMEANDNSGRDVIYINNDI